MEFPWLLWLAIFLSLTWAAALLTGLLVVSQLARARAERKAHFQAVWRAVRGIGVRLARLDVRLLELEEGVRRMKQHQEAVDLREPGEQLYQQAIRMARGGADIGELIANCGLSPGEAELVHRVHRHSTGTARLQRPRVSGRGALY